jgi:hypothetical protein
MPAPKRGSLIPVFVLSLIAAAASSCAVLQAPVSPPSFTRDQMRHGSTGGIEIDALPIQKLEDYWELFDDCLPEIGMVAVWVELRNKNTAGLDLSRINWELRRGTLRLREASIADIFKQYYKRRPVRFYSVNSDQVSRDAMSRVLLNTGRLGPSESRKGFLIFKSKSPQPPDWSRDGVLVARGFQPEADGPKTLELPLFHANP